MNFMSLAVNNQSICTHNLNIYFSYQLTNPLAVVVYAGNHGEASRNHGFSNFMKPVWKKIYKITHLQKYIRDNNNFEIW